ncbi:potassium channel family protein [Streptomyces sp. JNUCC 64]
MNETSVAARERGSAQARWEARTHRPLMVLAMVFALAYAVPIVVPDADPVVARACAVVEWLVWGSFAGDYGVRLFLSPDRRSFVRTHWVDLIVVLLPLVQPLRLLRLVSTLALVGRRARMASQIRLTTYVVGAVVGLLMFGSLAVLSVEREAPDGNIKTLGDAVWWSFTTMTTVGYGDHAPTTGVGRLLAVGLMLSGIALLGVVTANIAAWFIARFEKDDAEERRQTAAIEALASEVRALRAQVAALSGGSGAAVAGDGAGAGPGVPGRGAEVPGSASSAVSVSVSVSASASGPAPSPVTVTTPSSASSSASVSSPTP